MLVHTLLFHLIKDFNWTVFVSTALLNFYSSGYMDTGQVARDHDTDDSGPNRSAHTYTQIVGQTGPPKLARVGWLGNTEIRWLERTARLCADQGGSGGQPNLPWHHGPL